MQCNIVFVGAGWAGLSNLVGILRDLGFRNIIGIDGQASQITQQLQERGIQIFAHGKYTVQTEDIVIYSSATEGSEEVQSAFQLKKQHHAPLLIRDYFEFLGEMSKYFKTIGFTGTNGKSSSSAMGIFAASQTMEDFGIGIVGALVSDFGGKSYMINEEKKADIKTIFDYIFTGKKLNYDLVKKFYFFLEACEYQRHFLHLQLDSAIITNLELEHTDYFQDRADYESAFLEMIGKLKDKVFVLADLGSEKILNHEKTIVVPEEHFDFQHIWGEHQQKNASLVFGLLNAFPSIQQSANIKQQIEQFRGIWRRMESLKTTEKGAQIFSDYGHVASSLKVGLKALREKFPEKKITCIFQPHQMHRILLWWDEFPKALEGYDQTFIYDIYAAREKIEDFSEKEIFRKYALKTVEDLGNAFAQHCGSKYLKKFEEAEDVIEKAGEEEVIVVYSAGDIDYQLRKYLKLM